MVVSIIQSKIRVNMWLAANYSAYLRKLDIYVEVYLYKWSMTYIIDYYIFRYFH